MNLEYTYLLKVNLALLLFYAFYRLFFYKDTFFKLRRGLLLSFYGVAFIYPIIHIHDWIAQQPPLLEIATNYAAILPELEESLVSVRADRTIQFVDLLWIVYGIGALVFLIRFMIQLGSVIRIRFKSQVSELNGHKVHLLPDVVSPFSFFKMIFIHPASHSIEETSEILAHELTHVKQWHTVDVLISEMVTIVCWFNPFIWLLKREVRYNLEYLADQNVITTGFDTKSYQYHLLGLAQHTSNIYLYNSFNLLHIKNRILMMNKKRSTRVGITKYMMFIPIAAALMLASNFEAVARISALLIPEATIGSEKVSISGKVLDESNKPLSGANIVIRGSSEGTISDKDGRFSLDVPKGSIVYVSYLGKRMQSFKENGEKSVTIQLNREPIALEEVYVVGYGKVNADNSQKEKDKTIFAAVEEMPEFPGGTTELMKFLAQNIKYPVKALENGRQGKVICDFVVTEDGVVTNPEIVSGIDPDLDKEAIRIIQMMPRWTPGKQRGKAVAVQYTLPINFRLQQ